MSFDTYDVYFSGVCLKDADPDEVKCKIGAMFKLQGEKLDRLFLGKPVPIKRGVDMDRAVKFRVAFRDAGALVDIVPSGQPVPTARPQPQPRPAPRPQAAPSSPSKAQPSEPSGTTAAIGSAPSTASEASGMSLAEGPLPADESDAAAPPIPIPDYGLSAPQGFTLSDCAPRVEPAPIPHTLDLHLDKPGSDLDETPDPEPLEIDTEALDLDEPGVTLVETPETAPPEIDIDDLTLSAPREGSLEAYQQVEEATPLPNIDHLKLEESPGKEKITGKAKYVIAEN